MRTAGKFLIFGAVVLRATVVLADVPAFPVLVGLLGVYGLLLIFETWSVHGKPGRSLRSTNVQIAYLFLQTVLVLGLMVVSNLEDFLAELFIPLSLDAVSFFGGKVGFRLIWVFSLAMTGTLLFSSEGPLFGLAMGILYSGLCFLFGGYSSQVQKAEAARLQNQHTFEELQAAHLQLQGYADHVVQLTVERERSHLARDLHDSVTQTVFSMNLAAQSAQLLLDKEPGQVTSQLTRLEELAASAQREIQSLISHLSPAASTEMDLPTALHRLALEQGSKNGLQVSVEIRGERKISEAIVSSLYAIAREALTNVARHSGVCQAVVRLWLEEDNSCLEVEDHGRGFDPQTISGRRDHLGLAGMSERAREIGWTMSVESQPGRGTRLRVTEKFPGGAI